MKMLRVVLLTVALLVPGSVLAAEPLMMATTTSTQDTGLLDYLKPIFEKENGFVLNWVAVGTGKALAHGKACDVDVLLVHAPALEMAFVKDGYGQDRRQVMFNDYVLLGPPADPAGIKGKSVAEALKTLSEKKITFVSRGDNSGTHNAEKNLWQTANLAIPTQQAAWYVDAGQGMLATIRIADEKGGYTLTDRGTYIKYAASNEDSTPLEILVEGDATLRNQYSAMQVDAKHCPNVKQAQAEKFLDWWVSPKTQKAIADFTLEGKALFFPNAE